MKIHFITSLCLLLLTVTLANNSPWTFFLICFLLPFLLMHFISSSFVPGGFAWSKAPKGLTTPPGPVGWPILGCIPIMGPLAHQKLASLAKVRNSNHLMSLSLGTTPVVISSHPDTAKQILCGPAFSDRPIKTSARLLMFERAIGFAPSGEYWRHLRRVASANMFSPRRIAASEGLRRQTANNIIQEVSKEMSESGRVVLRDILQRGSLESVIGSVFGSDALGEREKREVVEMVREGYELIGRFNWGDHFHVGGILDFHGVGRRCRMLAARVRVLFGGIVEERGSRGELKGRDDFLSVLLGLPMEERLSDSDVIAVLWVSLSLSLSLSLNETCRISLSLSLSLNETCSIFLCG